MLSIICMRHCHQRRFPINTDICSQVPCSTNQICECRSFKCTWNKKAFLCRPKLVKAARSFCRAGHSRLRGTCGAAVGGMPAYTTCEDKAFPRIYRRMQGQGAGPPHQTAWSYSTTPGSQKSSGCLSLSIYAVLSHPRYEDYQEHWQGWGCTTSIAALLKAHHMATRLIFYSLLLEFCEQMHFIHMKDS